MASGQTTRDHETIRRWVEERGGHPAQVKRTSGSGTGILRIDFPGYSGEVELEEISWDDFFRKFDEGNLAFLFQDKTASGQQSRFSKIIRAGNEKGGRRRPKPAREGQRARSTTAARPERRRTTPRPASTRTQRAKPTRTSERRARRSK